MKGALVVVVVLAVAVSAVAAAKHHVRWSKPAIDKSLIQTINSNPKSTWKAGINHRFRGHTLKQIRHLLGTKLNGPKLPVKPMDLSFDKTSLPENYDVRDDYAEVCPSTAEIRDQSDCGSCWAFGAAEAFTDRVCIASNGTYSPHLSATDLLACCSSCGQGCDGGYPSAAWDYFQNSGVVTGGNYSENKAVDNGCFPYPFPPCAHHVNSTKFPACPSSEYSTPKCPKKCQNNENWKKNRWYVSEAYSVQGEDQIMQELYEHGSLEVDFTVYEDLLAYKSGVYKHTTGDELGGHAVKLIGYGVENGVKYWTIANSWNDSWGDHGVFKILRGEDECGIESDVNGGTVKLP